jgi:hypothetical protein
MEWLGNVVSFVGGMVAATLAAFVALRTNRSKMAADILARWDAALLEMSTEFTDAARRLRHHSEGFQRSLDKEDRTEELDDAHEKLRALAEQLRLVGDRRVQIAARLVVYHAYAVRVQGEEGRDPRESRFPDKAPVDRLNDALQEFYRAARHQLRAPDPEDVIHSDELHRIAEGVERLDTNSGSSA